MGLIRNNEEIKLKKDRSSRNVSFKDISEALIELISERYPKLSHVTVGKMPETLRSLSSLIFTIVPVKPVIKDELNICKVRTMQIQISVITRLDSKSGAYQITDIVEDLLEQFDPYILENPDGGPNFKWKTIKGLVRNIDIVEGAYEIQNWDNKRINIGSIVLNIDK